MPRSNQAGTVKHIDLGFTLELARKEKNLDLAEAAKDIRVKPETLQQFESGVVDLKNPYQRGLLESYCRFLELDLDGLVENELATKKRRLRNKKQRPLKRSFKSKRAFVASSSARVGFALGFVFLSFGGVALLIYIFFSAPKLHVNIPDNLEVKESSILVEGISGSGSDVFINATPVLVAPDGSFEQRVFLNPGVNILVVEAENNLSRKARVEKIVIANYEPFD